MKLTRARKAPRSESVSSQSSTRLRVLHAHMRERMRLVIFNTFDGYGLCADVNTMQMCSRDNTGVMWNNDLITAARKD
eukprot:31351-Eustigmatos_ZCMA.PRE.1